MGGQGKEAGTARKGEGERGNVKEEGKRRDRGRGRERKDNGDRPPSILGLKIALLTSNYITSVSRVHRA